MIINARFLSWITLLAALGPVVSGSGSDSTAAAAASEARAYRCARLWPGDGPPIDDALMLVVDGRIAAVGPASEVDVPEEAEILDLGPSVVIPGLVAARSGLGGVDQDDERAITPIVRAIDGFDLFETFDGPLSGGVTTAQLSPGRNRLMPGREAVVKLAGERPEGRILREVGDLRIVLDPAALNPPRIYDPDPRLVARDNPIDPSRPQLASSLAGAVSGLRVLLEAALDGPPEDQGTDLVIGPLAAALAETNRLRATTPGTAEIRAALDLARAFDLKLLLVGPEELDPFLDRLELWSDVVDGVLIEPGVRPGVVTNPPIPDPDDPTPRPAWDDAHALIDAGLDVAVVPEADGDLEELLFLAGLFTAGGLSEEQALQMVTATPAELLGVADRVGSLQAGKDADFVVLSADPFDLDARVREVFVSGTSAWTAKTGGTATLIRAAHVLTGSGAAIADGAVLVQDGKIRGLGADVSAPIDAEVTIFEGAYIIPGFFDLAADLGFGGPLSGSGTPNTNVGLDDQLGERVVSSDPAVPVARAGGITAVLAGPRHRAPAPLLALKLGDEPTVLKDPAAIRFELGGNLTSAVPALERTLNRGKAYADSWTKYEQQLAEYEKKKKEYEAAKARLEAKKRAEEARKKQEEEQNKQDAEDEQEDDQPDEGNGEDGDDARNRRPGSPAQDEDDDEGDEPKPEENEDEDDDNDKSDQPKDEDQDADSDADADELPEEPKPPKKPRTQDALEPYRALFAKEIPAFVEVEDLEAIRAAVTLFREDFDLETVLTGAEEAFRDAEPLAKAEVGVAVGPRLVRSVEGEPVNLAQVLANAGVAFGFQSEARTGAATLSLVVRHAARQGLGATDALRGLTIAPADFLGLDDRLGALDVGKDADLVVLSGPPFALSSRVLAVMIDGRWVHRDTSNGNEHEGASK